jgi:hypothetical protein
MACEPSCATLAENVNVVNCLSCASTHLRLPPPPPPSPPQPLDPYPDSRSINLLHTGPPLLGIWAASAPLRPHRRTEAAEVRTTPSWPRSWANFSFYRCVPTGMRGPTSIFWANLTPSSLEASRGRNVTEAFPRCECIIIQAQSYMYTILLWVHTITFEHMHFKMFPRVG